MIVIDQAAYLRAWRKRHITSIRWYERTRNRALRMLAEQYPVTFAEILAEVRAADPRPEG
jgi:hypothetical protein